MGDSDRGRFGAAADGTGNHRICKSTVATNVKLYDEIFGKLVTEGRFGDLMVAKINLGEGPGGGAMRPMSVPAIHVHADAFGGRSYGMQSSVPRPIKEYHKY